MIEASGHSQNVGRTIDDNFESTLTFELAHAIKNSITQKCPSAKVIINRGPGETVAPLQNANFANKLDVDFYEPSCVP